MLDELTIEGVRFVAARRAAVSVGLSRDYITRLCRQSAVQARRLAGGVWFVSELSLRAFLAEKELQKSIWRKQLSELRKAEWELAHI